MSKDSPVLYLHLGMHKTATSFLQKKVFPQFSYLNYVYKPRTSLVRADHGWRGALKSFFNRSPAIWRDLGDEIFAEIFEEQEQRRSALVSDENACIHLRESRSYLGGQLALIGHGPYEFRGHLEEIKPVARRWGFDRICVLLSIRRQDQWLASMYAQTSDRRHRVSQRHFRKYVDRILGDNFYINGVCLDYNLLKQQVERAVGTHNLLMLPYEMMSSDIASFVLRWTRFTNAPEGTAEPIVEKLEAAASERVNVRSRRKNVWEVRSKTGSYGPYLSLRPTRLFQALGLPARIVFRFPEFNRAKEIRMTEDLRKRILQAYSESNRKVESSLEVNLEQYGYFPNSDGHSYPQKSNDALS